MDNVTAVPAQNRVVLILAGFRETGVAALTPALEVAAEVPAARPLAEVPAERPLVAQLWAGYRRRRFGQARYCSRT